MERQTTPQTSPKGIRLMGILALACLVLAFFCGILATFFNLAPMKPWTIPSNFATNIAMQIHWLFAGLLLPVSMLLCSGEKKGISRLFAVLAAVLVGVQLFCAMLHPILLHLVGNDDFLQILIGNVPGSRMISGVVSFLQYIGYAGSSVNSFFRMTYILLSIANSSLFFLPNILCMIGFLRLSSQK